MRNTENCKPCLSAVSCNLTWEHGRIHSLLEMFKHSSVEIGCFGLVVGALGGLEGVNKYRDSGFGISKLGSLQISTVDKLENCVR